MWYYVGSKSRPRLGSAQHFFKLRLDANARAVARPKENVCGFSFPSFTRRFPNGSSWVQ